MAGKKKQNHRLEAEELRKLDVRELEKKLIEEREALMRARFQHATASLEDTALLKTLRRQIARVETIIKQKQLESQK